ncbi:helix-turn-helix domain-containing protein [Natronobacterium texcoconense]|uniref:Uncharacterized protein n=1 Tax=Natronobacterium texcoconense TaxID=1095778 RepID=A0A1H1CKM9_NATTX|nr:helix-turn-helix domain-containing protein [Natronobacterium texcoconense]SDQ64236.1 hypothetical protein SAMN04489842_1425 [Natronobacterium texcoconense]
MPVRGPDRDSDTSSDDYLRAQFRIEPHAGAGCPVLDAGEHGSDVSQDLRHGTTSCDGDCECRSEVTDRTDGEATYIRTDVTDRCVCPVFQQHDCIASIEGVEDGCLSVSITTPTRSELEAIVGDLRETGATIHLERIEGAGDAASTDSHAIEIDTANLTEKQREAVVAAVESGYYETPRRAALDDLADQLEVSKSAVSQRLNAVESKLVTSLVYG